MHTVDKVHIIKKTNVTVSLLIQHADKKTTHLKLVDLLQVYCVVFLRRALWKIIIPAVIDIKVVSAMKFL